MASNAKTLLELDVDLDFRIRPLYASLFFSWARSTKDYFTR